MAEDIRQPFQEAIDFIRQKVALPSLTWRDLEGRAHDRAFVVAGAIKEALINDLKAAVEKIPQGLDPVAWRAQFEEIVAKHGWTGWTGENTAAGRAWRARVIYDTNLRTAEAAGRYKQMTDPDVIKRRPYWRYRHAYTRVPEQPREDHVMLDNKVFRADDPIWDTIYPPNGWNCSCGVEPLTPEELEELGKDGPDAPPQLGTHTVRDPRTGQDVQTTNGIDFGWDHAPGQSWARGLVPGEMQAPLAPPVRPVHPGEPKPLPSLTEIARPFTAPLLPQGRPDAEYVDAFLSVFGATRDKPAMFRDAAGHAIPISADLFMRPDGTEKLRAYGQWRGAHLARLAEAIADPDEIWIAWAKGPNDEWRLVRRYLRSAPDSPEFASFGWTAQGWQGATAFPPTKGAAGKPDPDYLERQRQGALLWRRPKEKERLAAPPLRPPALPSPGQRASPTDGL